MTRRGTLAVALLRAGGGVRGGCQEDRAGGGVGRAAGPRFPEE